MDQQTNKDASGVVMRSGTDKKTNGMKYGIIVCALLAVAGIGFGVYGMLRKPEEKADQAANTETEAETELADLRQKYAALQKYIKDLEASGTEIPQDISNMEISSWETYVQNIKKKGGARANIFGNMTGGNGCGYETYSMPTASAFIDATGHLAIKAHDGGRDSQWETILEADGFLSAFYVTRGNGGTPSFILINEQGETFVIDIDKGHLDQKKELTPLSQYKNIVSAISGGDLYAHLTDIEGNIFAY